MNKKLEKLQELKGASVHAKRREIGSGMGIGPHYQNGGKGKIQEVFENKGKILFRIELTRNGRTMIMERKGFKLFRKQPAERPTRKSIRRIR